MADIICQQKVENAQGGFDNLIPYKAKNAVYDLIIRTQAEFEAMYNSPTWLGAKSVCFIGDGGTLKFTRSDGQGLKIPQNVHNILGLNNAIIEVNDFAYDHSNNRSAMWYETQPTAGDYSIDNLVVNCTGTGTDTSGFCFCSNLTNCTGADTGTGGYGYGFYSCSNLTNCTGTGTGVGGYGFSNCSNLTNCTGTGTGTSGYAFYSCSYCNGCRKSTTPSTTGIWGGTTTKRDDSSCDLD